MLHVCTAHWNDERWIAPQLRYFRRFLPEHRVYAALNGVDDRWRSEFAYAEDMPGSHPVKLNELAKIARADAHDDDLLLFIDSDAFPIAPIDASVLGDAPLAAVRRDENMGSRQPHPCFCVTTVGFWFDIEGDWTKGYEWEASNGHMVTDTGGNLLGILERRGIEWRPLLRSNVVDIDPLWFGVYADLAYHHGAGSRPPVSYIAALDGRKAMANAADEAVVPAWVPLLGRVERGLRYRAAKRTHERTIADYATRSQELSDEVFGWIESDPDFFERFLHAPASDTAS